MGNTVPTGAVHHLRLTVTDVARSQAFYTDVLGFQLIVDLPPGVILSNGSVLLGLGPSPDPERAIANDRFDENRVGLDHLSLSVSSRDELVNAVEEFDELGISHGEIKDLGGGFGISVLAFRDPDNIQLELTAPFAGDQQV